MVDGLYIHKVKEHHRARIFFFVVCPSLDRARSGLCTSFKLSTVHDLTAAAPLYASEDFNPHSVLFWYAAYMCVCFFFFWKRCYIFLTIHLVSCRDSKVIFNDYSVTGSAGDHLLVFLFLFRLRLLYLLEVPVVTFP